MAEPDLVKRARELDISAYVHINNRLEGTAIHTIEAIVKRKLGDTWVASDISAEAFRRLFRQPKVNLRDSYREDPIGPDGTATCKGRRV